MTALCIGSIALSIVAIAFCAYAYLSLGEDADVTLELIQ